MRNLDHMPLPVPQAAPARPPVCCPVHVRGVPGFSREKLGRIPLLVWKEAKTLTDAFQAAPQFAKVPLAQLFRERRGSLRVIFLTESGYYARQAAVYLATLSHLERQKEERPGKEEDPWQGLEELMGPEEEHTLENALTLVSPALLDPSLERSAGKERAVTVIQGAMGEEFRLEKLDTPALLIAAPSGPVLTGQVMEQLGEVEDREGGHNPPDLFVALKPGQVDLELLEELRFTHGFHVCRVGRPDQDYLRRFLSAIAGELLCPLDSGIDLDQVIAQARRYRGGRFNETDLEKLILWAVQRQLNAPLTTQDLVFSPFQDQRTGWKELNEMAGLEEVKQSLRRTLAAAALEDRRRERGLNPEPMCRNLAFAGPPGTGKSVTARLAAQILREEGRGTGRFVEAGREQLVGSYLGQTSPKIAELFQRAKGGVLFIDEAGALLDNSQGQDCYAAEAVNALVRHMELEPETMVVFATYPGEMERLLSSNPGLSSRVAQVLNFPAYDNGALWEIFQIFARKADCRLPEGAQKVCDAFFSALRDQKGGDFGNGREARRLFQGAMEELALRVLEGEEERLTLQDMEKASRRLLVQPEGKRSRPIGF